MYGLTAVGRDLSACTNCKLCEWFFRNIC